MFGYDNKKKQKLKKSNFELGLFLIIRSCSILGTKNFELKKDQLFKINTLAKLAVDS